MHLGASIGENIYCALGSWYSLKQWLALALWRPRANVARSVALEEAAADARLTVGPS
jgi:hypothetical protein